MLETTNKSTRKLRKLSLQETHPEIAKQWHPLKNIPLLPTMVSASYVEKVFWLCSNNHIWLATPRGRTKSAKTYCKTCRSLAYTHSNLTNEWHPTKNDLLTPFDVKAGSHVVAWWKCSFNHEHEWQAEIRARTEKGGGCQICNKRTVSSANCLAKSHPSIAAEWDYEVNDCLGFDPNNVTAISRKKVYWKCQKGHSWKAVIRDRTVKKTQCIKCIGRRATPENCLTKTHPDIAMQWHPIRNGTLSPEELTKGSDKKVWWICSKGHEWEAHIYSRTSGRSCMICNRWTLEAIRLFVKDLLPYLNTLGPAELYVIFQQQEGLLESTGKSKAFIQAFKTGRFPQEELERFVAGQASLVDEFIYNQNTSIEQLNSDLPNDLSGNELIANTKELPVVETADILASFDSKIISSANSEVIDFLIKSAVAKIWNHAFLDELKVREQLLRYQGNNEYAKQVRQLFSSEYEGAKALQIPDGYKFPHQPNLMQRRTVYLVKTRKRIGNWSGTGAGKTNAAILASRDIEAEITVICCPNNTISNWKDKINAVYPDSILYTKEDILRIRKIPKKINTYCLIMNFFNNQIQRKNSRNFFLNAVSILLSSMKFIIQSNVIMPKSQSVNN